jgi:hypothetical protein
VRAPREIRPEIDDRDHEDEIAPCARFDKEGVRWGMGPTLSPARQRGHRGRDGGDHRWWPEISLVRLHADQGTLVLTIRQGPRYILRPLR